MSSSITLLSHAGELKSHMMPSLLCFFFNSKNCDCDHKILWHIIWSFLNISSSTSLNAVSLGVVLTGFYPKLKSFWSCSHMKCSKHYMLHINLHILYIYYIMLKLNLKEFQESINYFKSYQVNKIGNFIE